jgi:hypothetical protein
MSSLFGTHVDTATGVRRYMGWRERREAQLNMMLASLAYGITYAILH